MTVRYRIIMYERTTDHVGGIIDVPAALAVEALAIAGVADADEPGEIDLDDSQAIQMARLLGFRANVTRYIYHLETVLTTDDRLRA
jgi:hypothetical protein